MADVVSTRMTKAARGLPRTGLRILGLLTLALALSACETIQDWFAESVPPPLPGERISVLSLQQTLEPDPLIADLQVRLPRPVVNRDWPQAGGQPNHAMHHLAVGDALRVAWRANMGKGSSNFQRLLTPPIVFDGMVFGMDAESRVSALDAATGKRLWRVSLKPDEEDDGGYGGGVAAADGVLYATTGFGEVLALDPADGGEIWRRQIGVPFRGSPTVSAGRIFAVSYDNRLHVLAGADGRSLWTHEGIPETAGLLGAAGPAVEGNIVVVPYSSGEIFAFRVDNGRIAWSDSLTRTGRLAPLATLNDIQARPVIDRDQVYAISHSGRFVAINLRSGARVWDQLIAGVETPWVAGDFIFLVTLDAELVCLWRRDGRIRWVTQLPRYKDEDDRRDPINWSGPVLVSDRLVVVSSDGKAFSVSPYSGEVLGRIRLRDSGLVSPIVANGTLYILTDNAELTALR